MDKNNKKINYPELPRDKPSPRRLGWVFLESFTANTKEEFRKQKVFKLSNKDASNKLIGELID